MQGSIIKPNAGNIAQSPESENTTRGCSTKAAPLSHPCFELLVYHFCTSVLFFCLSFSCSLFFREPFFATLVYALNIAAHRPDHVMTVQAASGEWQGVSLQIPGRLARYGWGVPPELSSLAWRLVSCGPLPTQLGWRCRLWEGSVGGSLKKGAGYKKRNDRPFSSLTQTHLPLLSV